MEDQSEKPGVLVMGGVEVSAEDAIALEMDTFLYGDCYVEVYEGGTDERPKRGRRIDPQNIRTAVR